MAKSNQILTTQSHVSLVPTLLYIKKSSVLFCFLFVCFGFVFFLRQKNYSKDLIDALTNFDPGETLSSWIPG